MPPDNARNRLPFVEEFVMARMCRSAKSRISTMPNVMLGMAFRELSNTLFKSVNPLDRSGPREGSEMAMGCYAAAV